MLGLPISLMGMPPYPLQFSPDQGRRRFWVLGHCRPDELPSEFWVCVPDLPWQQYFRSIWHVLHCNTAGVNLGRVVEINQIQEAGHHVVVGTANKLAPDAVESANKLAHGPESAHYYPLLGKDVELLVGAASGSVAEVARNMGLADDTAWSRLQSLLRRLEAAGYDVTPVRVALRDRQRQRGRRKPIAMTDLIGDQVADVTHHISYEREADR